MIALNGELFQARVSLLISSFSTNNSSTISKRCGYRHCQRVEEETGKMKQ